MGENRVEFSENAREDGAIERDEESEEEEGNLREIRETGEIDGVEEEDL